MLARKARVEAGIGYGSVGIVYVDAALTEVAGVFGGGGNRIDHHHVFDVAKAFVVREEIGLLGKLERTAERCAEVVLNQEIHAVHLVE